MIEPYENAITGWILWTGAAPGMAIGGVIWGVKTKDRAYWPFAALFGAALGGVVSLVIAKGLLLLLDRQGIRLSEYLNDAVAPVERVVRRPPSRGERIPWGTEVQADKPAKDDKEKAEKKPPK